MLLQPSLSRGLVVVCEDGRSQRVVGEEGRRGVLERGDADEELRAVRCQVALGLGAEVVVAGLCHSLAERLRELRYQQSSRAVLGK